MPILKFHARPQVSCPSPSLTILILDGWTEKAEAKYELYNGCTMAVHRFCRKKRGKRICSSYISNVLELYCFKNGVL